MNANDTHGAIVSRVKSFVALKSFDNTEILYGNCEQQSTDQKDVLLLFFQFFDQQ